MCLACPRCRRMLCCAGQHELPDLVPVLSCIQRSLGSLATPRRCKQTQDISSCIEPDQVQKRAKTFSVALGSTSSLIWCQSSAV